MSCDHLTPQTSRIVLTLTTCPSSYGRYLFPLWHTYSLYFFYLRMSSLLILSKSIKEHEFFLLQMDNSEDLFLHPTLAHYFHDPALELIVPIITSSQSPQFQAL